MVSKLNALSRQSIFQSVRKASIRAALEQSRLKVTWKPHVSSGQLLPRLMANVRRTRGSGTCCRDRGYRRRTVALWRVSRTRRRRDTKRSDALGDVDDRTICHRPSPVTSGAAHARPFLNWNTDCSMRGIVAGIEPESRFRRRRCCCCRMTRYSHGSGIGQARRGNCRDERQHAARPCDLVGVPY